MFSPKILCDSQNVHSTSNRKEEFILIRKPKITGNDKDRKNRRTGMSAAPAR